MEDNLHDLMVVALRGLELNHGRYVISCGRDRRLGRLDNIEQSPLKTCDGDGNVW